MQRMINAWWPHLGCGSSSLHPHRRENEVHIPDRKALYHTTTPTNLSSNQDAGPRLLAWHRLPYSSIRCPVSARAGWKRRTVATVMPRALSSIWDWMERAVQHVSFPVNSVACDGNMLCLLTHSDTKLTVLRFGTENILLEEKAQNRKKVQNKCTVQEIGCDFRLHTESVASWHTC